MAVGDLFQRYEREFAEHVSAIRAAQSREGQPGIDQLLAEAESLLWKMSNEARSLPAEQNASLLKKVTSYRAQLRALQEGRHAAAASSARRELGLAGNSGRTTAAQRDRLLSSTAKLEKSGERIRQSQQMVASMEEQGASILESLHSQRTTIQRSRDRLKETDENISVSQKILKRMGRWLPF